MKALVIPPAAQRDARAVQMIGAWIAEQGLHCSLNIGMWEAQGRKEAGAWGVLLADVVRHISNALQEERGVDPDDTISEIVDSLLDELNNPTSKATGSFRPGHA